MEFDSRNIDLSIETIDCNKSVVEIEFNRRVELVEDVFFFLVGYDIIDVFDPRDQLPHCRKDLLENCGQFLKPDLVRHLQRFYKPEADLDAFVQGLDHDIIKFFMIFLSPEDKQEALRRLMGEPYTVAESSPWDLEIMPVGINKGTGLDILSKALGLTQEQIGNRMLLREAMLKHGFKPLRTEWWHFTLRDEPYPDTYFDFPVREIKEHT